MNTPNTSTIVVIKGADIKAGSNPKVLKTKGKAEPAIEAKIAIITKDLNQVKELAADLENVLNIKKK